MSATDGYNYARFDLAAEEPVIARFGDALHVGTRPPDGTLEDLATGERVTVRSLYRGGPAVLEFGSFS